MLHSAFPCAHTCQIGSVVVGSVRVRSGLVWLIVGTTRMRRLSSSRGRSAAGTHRRDVRQPPAGAYIQQRPPLCVILTLHRPHPSARSHFSTVLTKSQLGSDTSSTTVGAATGEGRGRGRGREGV